jgi:hypothetical protein
MINPQPVKCNICGGRVEYISNTAIYGREYGSGKCYRCIECGAYVGTHVPRPTEALGILSNAEMRAWKMRCHAIFDGLWKNGRDRKEQCDRRRKSYGWLAKKLGMSRSNCHFGYFDLPTLKRAYGILKRKEMDKGDE